MKKELQLYIHIPFCVKKCAYCDFLSGPSDAMTIQRYVESLVKEIRANKEVAQSYYVTTVFLGGGTPSLLTGLQMKTLLSTLFDTFEVLEDAEISMEVNPGTVSKEKLEAYHEAGINRISIGLQSVNDDELKLLGRIHSYETFLESYNLARKCGFDNINIDLISAVPGQTLESWEKSLKTVVELEPEHISAYSLIIEEGTPFAAQYGEGTQGEKYLPSEDEEREIYRRTEEILGEFGFERYEISNYAKNGKTCKHNLGYWERKNYLGFGIGAASLLENTRFSNIDDINIYINNSDNLNEIRSGREVLDKKMQMEEFIFLGMRKMEGISIEKFEKTFSEKLYEVYGHGIASMEEKGLVIVEDGRLKLTEKGIDLSNFVFAEILFE